MTTAMEAFKAARDTRTVRTRRPALAVLGAGLVALASVLGRRLPSFAALRTTVLAIGGFGCLATAAWMVAVPLGVAAAGLALLVLEFLSGKGGERG